MSFRPQLYYPLFRERFSDPLPTQHVFTLKFSVLLSYTLLQGFPWWFRWWRICLQCGRSGSDHCVGKIPWRRAWQPTPVFLPRESHGQRSQVGYSPWGCRVRHEPLSTAHTLYYKLNYWGLFSCTLFVCLRCRMAALLAQVFLNLLDISYILPVVPDA